ncbi:nucleotide sugar dehydrogenase [Allobranchiibius huperziae]|uniref:Nucleotide sugar dehydrogenase n=1 Tax=Allobranchiibius huperziae TaxID=1874116 RepID=A0A853DN01_9MICO|nr:nucleotide sugar dehydrogenase [Allobranchiibius huperziae]NYJ75515.1 nucleotide sugar dehydrogenase [Allobranchiibius huperziae]
MNTVVVIGQGYVGLPMALRAAQVGHSVTGLELNETVVENLNRGVSHIGDIGEAELSNALSKGYIASADPACIERADVVVVCVPTPLGAGGGPDLGAVENAAHTIARHVKSGTLCILESTTYPGTTEEIFGPIVAGNDLEIGSDLFVAFSPERIDPGNEQYGVKNTPKVVGGITDACTAKARDFYQSFIDTVVPAKRAREAEMAKLLENTFRHVNIALVNEMVRFSRELDIDLGNAIDAAATKPFGFMAFRPGPGVGGHCIPVDPSYLSHRVKAKLGYAFRMVELAEEINQAAPGYVANRIRNILNDDSKAVRGARILLLGVAYKANIADQRESPADPLALRLLAWGATVRYHDPYVSQWRPRGTDQTFDSVTDLDGEMRESDLVVLMQAHDYYDLSAMNDADVEVLDTRGVLEGKRVHGL